ncbi:MAG: GTP-binding protein [Pseudomonadales bacterium]|nr:GTP-binding protein [Pseudomonadales bacterium]
MATKRPLLRIPTNIITGFLGVGKTTAIQQLLKQRPTDERWAILVNEFGEVGIDNSLFSGTTAENSGVTISQVPGGCMCCTNGLPMQMALNLLLAKAKPHRLLIEPTGLGHPKEVLAILSGQHYREVLNLQSTLALVDARKIRSGRYTTNSTFNQQLEIAEVIIANKSDLYKPEDFPALLDFIDAKFGLEEKLVYQVQHGAIALEWLDHPANKTIVETHQHHQTESQASALTPSLETPSEGFVRADNQGEGFFSRGWIFNPGWQFSKRALFDLVQSIEAERLKGVFITPHGCVGFNKVDNVVTQLNLETCADSRVEVIGSRLESFDEIEEALLNCVKNRTDSTHTLMESESKSRNEKSMELR